MSVRPTTELRVAAPADGPDVERQHETVRVLLKRFSAKKLNQRFELQMLADEVVGLLNRQAPLRGGVGRRILFLRVRQLPDHH